MTSMLETETNCPHCGRKLMTMAGQLRSIIAGVESSLPVECDCFKAKQDKEQAVSQGCSKAKRDTFKNSGMPPRFKRLSIDTYTPRDKSQSEGLREMKAFHKNAPSRGVFVLGEVGAGKTYLTACAMRSCASNGIFVTWRTLAEMLLEFRETYRGKSPVSESDLVKRYSQCEILVLDDLGKERVTDWAQALLFNIIDTRINHERPLIVTSNYGRKALIERLTPINGDAITAAAIVDRIIGNCVTVVLKGESRREATLAKQEGETTK